MTAPVLRWSFPAEKRISTSFAFWSPRRRAGAYRALGDRAAYVRQRGFEPLQQEQMVLQYVEKHGRITRREAAELCRTGNPQAYRLLCRLSEKGLLARDGERGRSVSYRRDTR